MTRAGAAAIALALLAGCQAVGPAEQAGPALGLSSAEETCRSALRRAGARADTPVWDVLCGTSARPVGAVHSAIDPGRETGARAVVESSPYRALTARADCRPPEAVRLAEIGEAWLSSCALKDGGWPWMALTIVAPGRLAFGEGTPGAVPAFAQALAQGPFTPAARRALLAELTSRVGAESLASGAAAGSYQDFVELARVQNSVGNHGGAERAYRQALDLQTRTLGPDHPGLGSTLTQLGLEVSNQDRVEEADAIFRRAEALVLRATDPGEYPRYLAYLGLHAANRRDYARALTIARDAIQRRRALIEQSGGGIPASLESGGGAAILGSAVFLQGELAHALMFASSMAQRTADLGSAEAFAVEARRIVEQTPGLPPWWRPQAWEQLGGVLALRGDFRGAERLLAGAVTERTRIFGATWPTAQALMGLARAQADEGRYAEALGNYRQAFAIAGQETPARALSFEQIQPFLAAAEAQARAEPGERETLHAEMFAAVQMLRDGTMGRAISRMTERLTEGGGRTGELARELDEASRRRDRLQIELAVEPGRQRDLQREAAARAELTAVRATIARLEEELAREAPGFARLASAKPIEPARLARELRDGEALALYVAGPEGAYAFLATKAGVRAAKLDADEERLAEDVGRLREAFRIRDRSVQPFDLALAHRLYRTLLGPFENELAATRQLYVVGNGPLASLPFSVLTTAPSAPNDYAAAPWLARRMAIASPPSVRAFLDMRAAATRPSAPNPLLAIANPVFAGAGEGLGQLANACRGAGAVPSAMISALAPLPETADEARRVAATLGAGADSLLLGADATAGNFRARDLASYRVLYFATHGLLPGELRCQGQPGLALTPPATDAADAADDGLLEAAEIAALRLDADLVVLSACNTAASGDRLGGESLSGLAEAFFAAGARGLLVTHWQVPSEQTVLLTTRLFDRLGGNLKAGVAPALRDSQMRLAADPATAHPFFWGAFVLQGDGAAAVANSAELR
ncbi:MAG: CHAT domain-containing protein [Tagaea sp.]|nr:CHAT domain-containing protein [Tagaea sp.]